MSPSGLPWIINKILRSSSERQFNMTNFISPKRTPPKSPHRLGLSNEAEIFLKGYATYFSIWFKALDHEPCTLKKKK